MIQKGREDVAGNLMEEMHEIENFDHSQKYEEEIRSITAECGALLTLVCC